MVFASWLLHALLTMNFLLIQPWDRLCLFPHSGLW
jgi:hypothetical protein